MPGPVEAAKIREKQRTITIDLVACLPDAPAVRALPLRVSEKAFELLTSDAEVRNVADRLHRISRFTSSLDYDKINVVMKPEYFGDAEATDRVKAAAVSAVVTALRASPVNA